MHDEEAGDSPNAVTREEFQRGAELAVTPLVAATAGMGPLENENGMHRIIFPNEIPINMADCPVAPYLIPVFNSPSNMNPYYLQKSLVLIKSQFLALLRSVDDVLIFLLQTRFCEAGHFQHYLLSENVSKMGFSGDVDQLWAFERRSSASSCEVDWLCYLTVLLILEIE